MEKPTRRQVARSVTYYVDNSSSDSDESVIVLPSQSTDEKIVPIQNDCEIKANHSIQGIKKPQRKRIKTDNVKQDPDFEIDNFSKKAEKKKQTVRKTKNEEADSDVEIIDVQEQKSVKKRKRANSKEPSTQVRKRARSVKEQVNHGAKQKKNDENDKIPKRKKLCKKETMAVQDKQTEESNKDYQPFNFTDGKTVPECPFDNFVDSLNQKVIKDEKTEKSKNDYKPLEFIDSKMVSRHSFKDLMDSLYQKGNLEEMHAQDLCLWRDEEVVADSVSIPVEVAKNVINLFNQDCTIPFIARYRKEVTGGLLADKLREIQESYDSVKVVHKKVDNILKSLAKETKLTPDIAIALANAKTVSEIEHLYAPYKPGNKKSFAERAKSLGLESISLQLLQGTQSLRTLNIASFIHAEVKGLSTESDVLKGVQYIIADIIAKDRDVLDYIRKVCRDREVQITSSKSPAAEKLDKQAFVEDRETKNYKFENYYNFNISAKLIKPHQVMALNRGESLKVLKVKVILPQYVKNRTLQMCWSKWCRGKVNDSETYNFMNKCIEDAYDRLLERHICRQIRSEFTKKAEKESVLVFSSNLKRLLLTPPVRGNTVVGIDPGFSHGCKVAVVSLTGEVLRTDIIYPFKFKVDAEQKLYDMLTTFLSKIIALGNGTACRETESWLTNALKSYRFKPLGVEYCMVNENGVSIYSVTKEAEADLPGMDPNLRSAVSIARRLQDPLLEYVKVEPKHLGVGMYQHDIAESMLKKALDSVVVECVSFVGVDLNVCPEVLLRKISGLSITKAKNIIEWREKNGSFINLQQLLLVKGLGQKSFEQCAGFVKILPQTCINMNSLISESETMTEKRKKEKTKSYFLNPLDMTVIHPESYSLAERLLKDIKAHVSEMGKPSLILKVNEYLKSTNVEYLAKTFDVSAATLQLIVDAFRQPIEYDIRAEFEKPLFKTEVTSLEDLKEKQVLTGRIENVTHFGAFVDIGVGHNGLIHISKMKNQQIGLGDRVTVQVIGIDVKKKRISLQFLSKS